MVKNRQQQERAQKGAASKARSPLKDPRSKGERKKENKAIEKQSIKSSTHDSYKGSAGVYFNYVASNSRKDSAVTFKDYCSFRKKTQTLSKEKTLKALGPKSFQKVLTAIRKVKILEGKTKHWSIQVKSLRAEFPTFMEGLERDSSGKPIPTQDYYDIDKDHMERCAAAARAQHMPELARCIEFTWWGAFRIAEALEATKGRISRRSNGEFSLVFDGSEKSNKTNWKGFADVEGCSDWLGNFVEGLRDSHSLLFPNITEKEVNQLLKNTAKFARWPQGLSWCARGLRNGRAVYLRARGSSIEEIRRQLKHKPGSQVTFRYLTQAD